MKKAVRKIDIIIPSFKDRRIANTIASIRAFDVDNDVGILVLDGSQDEDFLVFCQALLGPRDQIISERDEGIFDALNKGLTITDAPVVGWLGSDDMFVPGFTSKAVKKHFEARAEVVVFSTAYHRGGIVTRTLRSSVVSPFHRFFGLHNAHFSTFVSRNVADSFRFELSVSKISDIDYFLRIFASQPRTVRVNAISTLMAEGGYASGSFAGIYRSFADRFAVFNRQLGVLSGLCAPGFNALWKIWLLMEGRIKNIQVASISYKETDEKSAQSS